MSKRKIIYCGDEVVWERVVRSAGERGVSISRLLLEPFRGKPLMDVLSSDGVPLGEAVFIDKSGKVVGGITNLEEPENVDRVRRGDFTSPPFVSYSKERQLGKKGGGL